MRFSPLRKNPRSRRKTTCVSGARIEATIETLELMVNPKAMKAIRAYEAGKGKFKDASCLDENQGSIE